MTRPTLKLPAKPAAEASAWSPPRKPVRGGVKGKKAVPTSAPQDKAPQQSPTISERPRRAAPPVASAAAPTAPKRREVKARPAPAAASAATPPKKIHPPRGIARSSGARALPPQRSETRPASTASATPGQQPPHQPQNAPPARAVEPPLAEVAIIAAASPPRRAPSELPRLAKRVAEMAQCSRRLADEWIENGWVSVDGVVVTTLGTRVHAKARIEITDAAQTHHSEAVTIIYHRPPAGEAQSADADGLPPLAQIRADNRWPDDVSPRSFKTTQLRGLAPVGKLDPDASGMLVYTQEGSVARRITGDETRLEKEYLVRVDGALDADGLARLAYGLELDGVKLRRAQASWQSEQQLRLVLHESRKRQIARMCELVGLRVVAIRRIRIGSVPLGKLPAGQWRYLRDDERF